MEFLPKDYQAPKAAGNYMKLQDGENKFRILSQPVLGWEDWVDNKPVRYRMDSKPMKPHDAKKPVKHFWAFIVWNHFEEKIQIFQITQATLRNALEALCQSEDWGAPYFYDIKIFKKGEGVNTEYNLTPVPHKPLPDGVKKAFDEKRCNLEMLFENQDPFLSGYDSYTPGIFSKDSPKIVSISQGQAIELLDMLKNTDPTFQKTVNDYIRGPDIKAASIHELPVEHFDKIKTAVSKKITESKGKAA